MIFFVALKVGDIMKKFLFAAALIVGVVMQSKFDASTGKISAPSKKGCPKSANGEHKWWTIGVKTR